MTIQPALAAVSAGLFLASVLFAGPAAPETAPVGPLAAAVANPDRPDVDRQRDAERKPADLLAFSGVKAGDKVSDLIPGGGYFTRLFSSVVGPTGHVYAFYPSELRNFLRVSLPADGAAPWPKFANVTAQVAPVDTFSAPEPLDMVWTSLNYHDLHDPFFAPADLHNIDRAVFQALKPGGVFMIVDHVAEAGSGLRDTDTLHRIDEAVVKAEVEAAGFKLEAESDVLRNPADTHALSVFDPRIRSHTDQFALKFRKPAA